MHCSGNSFLRQLSYPTKTLHPPHAPCYNPSIMTRTIRNSNQNNAPPE